MEDLAKHYTTARLQGRLSGNEVSFSENKVFTEEDIEAAFNAGRESVVENIPKLEWKECICNNDEYFTSCCPAGRYKVSHWRDLFEVWYNAYFICYQLSLSEAKQAANKDYQNRIKQALGL